MDVITVDEKNKKRIQRHIKQEIAFYGGYEQDIELLEQRGQLTEALAMKVFIDVLNDAHRIRTILQPEENDEFQDLMDEVYSKYDAIEKPRGLEEYGYYDGGRINYMNFDEVYFNMQTAFEVKELDTKYYACKDLRDIANTVINSIDGIEKYKIELQPESKEELQIIQEELRKLLNSQKTDIQAIQERVDKYNEYATDIWNDYLTGIDNEKDNQYRWVIHNLTKGELQGDFRDRYMSTSLITNNTMGVYGRANYGLIIKPKHIVSASYKDSYTLNTRDDEENLFTIRRPPLMLPQEIEEICVQQTISANGEMLNYEKAPIYSELVVDEYEVEGMYYISNGEQEFAPNYDVAKKMAEERGLPLIERDISKYRAELGLEPMTEITKRSLCGNILRKCCAGDKELELLYSQFYKSFINNHFQEFYQKFMQLKENPEYSKEDILKAFADVARGDIDFDQVSQNIDEKYMSDEILEKATIIVEENENAKQSHTDDSEKQQEPIDETCIINEFGEIIRENNSASDTMVFEEIEQSPISKKIELDFDKMIEADLEYTRTHQTYQQSQVVQDYWNRVNAQQAKEYEQQQPEKIRPREESIRDVIGDEKDIQRKLEMQEVKRQTIDLWMNRFDSWYSTIDRVSQNVKAKFVKMKSDIVNVISNKIKERMNKRQVNTQEQDSSER